MKNTPFIQKRNTPRRLARFVAALLAVVMISGCLAACSQESSGVDYKFSFSLSANPRNLDPQMANDNNSLMVIRNIYEGLMRTDSTGDLIPGVAERYDVNAEMDEYIFYLREDACWSLHDENDKPVPVTAYDFEFAWRRALMPETNSSTCLALYCIQNAEAIHKGEVPPEELGVTVIDEHTLKVVLEYPYAEFPLQTTQAVYMPCNQSFFESTSGHYGLDDDYVISNGPFCFYQNAGFLESTANSWNHDNYVRMIRNQNYSGENKCLPAVLYLGIRNPKTVYYELLTEETVEAAKIESEYVDRLEDEGYLTYTYTDCTWGLVFNTAANGFDDAYVRQAFSMCVDTELYEGLLADNTEVAYDIIPPVTKLNGMLYRELAGSGMKLRPDPSKAYDLLKKGYANQGRTSLPTITVICPDDENVVQFMQALVQSWRDNLLIYVNLEPLSESTLNNRVDIGDYQIALWCLAPSKDSPLECLEMFDSSTYYNPARLNSPAYDRLIDLSAAKTNTEDILAPLVAAEKYLNNMSIFYPMYYETTYYATWDNVDGIYFSPFDGTADFMSATCTE